ncbi:MAG: hypothetical protein ACTSUB_09520 [Candidatus Thorarchaeota archaeon]
MRYADETMDLDGKGVSAARKISRLTPAPLINLYVGIIIAFGSPTNLGPILNSWSVLLLVVVFMVLLPVAPIVLEAWRGNIDLDVSVQEMRVKFFLNAIFFYIIAFIVFFLTECHVMVVLSVAYIMVTVGVMSSTMKSKVSVHAAGIGGPSTALFYMYGIIAIPVILLWILVIWARTTLKQHTLTQSIIGLIIGIVITIITYELLWW